MDNKDIRHRETVLLDYIAGRIKRGPAAVRLGVSEAHVSVMKKRYLAEGKASLVHGNTSKHSKYKTENWIANAVVELYNSFKVKFNFAHFYDFTMKNGELLKATKGVVISFSTVSKILRDHGIKSPNAHHKSKVTSSHPRRLRRPRKGELVQADACIAFFTIDDFKMTLHAFVDDATSEVLGAHFAMQETTEGYVAAFRDVLTNHGIPQTIYTDNRTTFVCNQDKKLSKDSNVQFARMCKEFGSRIITTSSAQAKGRVERFMRTAQDRLANELKANGISGIAAANTYLKEVFIPAYNQKYGVPPEDPRSAFSELSPLQKRNLDYILSIHHTCTILRGNVISYKGKQYLPIDEKDNPVLLPIGMKVEIVVTFDQRVTSMIYNSNYYQMKQISVGRPNTNLPPAPEHPWKRQVHR